MYEKLLINADLMVHAGSANMTFLKIFHLSNMEAGIRTIKNYSDK